MIINDTLEIPVSVKTGDPIKLKISGVSNNSLFLMEGSEAIESEPPYQIVEGKYYHYRITEGYFIKDSFGIITRNHFNGALGTISPNTFVGTLSLSIYRIGEEDSCGVVKLEVQSIKTDYRSDYRKMLSDITEHCIELIFQYSSPVTQIVEPEYDKENRTWHQRFAFIKSIIDTDEFNDSVSKVISAPVTKWKERETEKDIRSIRRLNSRALRQIAGAANRMDLPDGHCLKSDHLKSIPSKLRSTNKVETVDTPENRFVKHALQSFLFFVSDFKGRINDKNKTNLEAAKIESQLELYLNHSIFKEISNPISILLNSPVLQRKEGYREILKVWLMFNLAAKLTWKGGDDVYDIEKRNVATLYEYWLFFELIKIVEDVFGIAPGKELIVDTNDKLGLQLKQGKHFPIKGVCKKYSRKLEVQLSYNRTFPGNNTENINYPEGGSWTRSMRPDYTLSIWPFGISEAIAEKEELIVHIHFDAKYKIEKIIEALGEVESLDEEKEEQNKGNYKRADLLKMHSYKDAIRRTGGAYILYPGNEKTSYKKMGFRELIPGLGAFQIRPSVNNDTGAKDLEKFFVDVVYHFVNRTSQREKLAFRTYDIHKDMPRGDKINEPLPESYEPNRNFNPDETFILVGYSTTPDRFKWYEKNSKYIFRMDEVKGSLELTNDVINAKYLLLRKRGEDLASDLFKVISKGPKVFSAKQLAKLNYPLSDNPKEYYLAIEIERAKDKEFENLNWRFKDLKKYKDIIESEKSLYSRVGIPFTLTLTELMQVVKK